LSEPNIKQRLELWGGVECTINRVRDAYFEQLPRLGHHSRISDLDLIAELGVTALRQPILWESVAPNGLANADWDWSDRWLAHLRELGIRPIVGLLHHGSGPRSTDLLDDDFPQKLAEYAEAVARRYPWVQDYTPVNEPLTTARFSALYGHWYPHARDDRSFLRALLNQCRAVVLAIKAIRRVNPEARLVQTEDLGKTFSTPRLRYQSDFENERRWLSCDLLCGRVNSAHPLWHYLERFGVPEEQLGWLADNPVRPDILGFNYYLSSERYLDDDVARYPAHTRGGNGRDRYVDIESARVRFEGLAGPGALLREAQERYQLPVAITECHNGCTREEQLRWFAEIWGECEKLHAGGMDIRAVTAWSMLGAFDWNSLVTRKADHYEPGLFDVRSPRPRKTAIAPLAKALASGTSYQHPLLEAPGWWHRPERFVHDGAVTDRGKRVNPHGLSTVGKRTRAAIQPLLITGGTGTLGRAFARACVIRGIPYRLTLRSEMDIADNASLSLALNEFDPWAVINTAGFVRVDDAESDPESCFRENTDGAVNLAAECANRGIQLVTFSSDLVFDGQKGSAYLESDSPNPLNVYGLSKAAAEQGVLQQHPGALVVRTSAFFGPWDEYNFVTVALRELAQGRSFSAPVDSVISPTYVPDLVSQTLDLMIDGETGVWHLANQGSISWYELARCAAEMAGVDSSQLRGCRTADLRLPAERPLQTALASERGWIMPSLENALQRYLDEREPLTNRELEAA
jgi:dTDP-4-dehydrorhamnose reductase